MSRINGDKSRFNRERKQKLARRKRNRQLLAGLAASQAQPAAGDAAKKASRS
jgi:hypothetical protein